VSLTEAYAGHQSRRVTSLHPVRRPFLPAALSLALALAGASIASLAAAPPPRIVIAEVDGPIHPISAEFLVSAVDRADATGAAAVIILLRTPGGLVVSTRTIVSRLIAARTPIVVYVAPSGARAASAGFLITMAADVAVMAPGTHVGAAHPVGIGGAGPDKTATDKAVSDVAAFARTLAQARHRNVSLADEAVTKSRSFTDREAVEASPPLVDFVATSLDDVVRQLDGRTVTRFSGARQTLHTAGAARERIEMTWRQRLLGVIADPQIAYLLFTLGLLGLTVELWNPGSVLPGVVGCVCLLLAFLAFQVLPINISGLLLIVLGIGLLILEVKTPSYGALGLGGSISLVLGSIVMMGDMPEAGVGLQLVLPVGLAFSAIFLFLGRLAMSVRRQAPVTGVDALTGAEGQALTDLTADHPGQVAVRGEIWSATSAAPVAAGSQVRVLALRGLTLTVADASSPDQQGSPT
jgi:membrane-bound serine protease (ClpP class)